MSQMVNSHVGRKFAFGVNVLTGGLTTVASSITRGITSSITAYRLYVYGGYDIKEGTLDSLWAIDVGRIN
jgi:hypothetical protein